MGKVVSFDKQGRIYIPEEIRKRLSRTLVLRTYERGIVIESIDDDPIKALANLGREKLKKKTIKELKEEARKDIENNAYKKIRR